MAMQKNQALPTLFYYFDKSNTVSYTNIPQAGLSVSRLIEGKNFWKKKRASLKKKPKTVILCDWTAQGKWRASEILKLQEKLAEMMAQGFTLYIWQKGRLVKRCSSRLNYDLLHGMTPASHEDILTVAASHKLSRDKVLLLDDYQINLLLGQSAEAPRLLPGACLYDLDNNTALLKDAQPPIEGFLVNQLDYQTDNTVKKLEEFLENYNRTEPHKLTLVKRYDQINPAVFTTEKGIEFLNDIDAYVDQQNCFSIDFSNFPLDGNFLSFLRKKKPSITMLTLDKHINKEVLSHVNLENLTIIQIETDFSAGDTAVMDLLANAPIKFISLSHYDPKIIAFLENFPLTEEMEIVGKYSLDDLERLLNGKRDLKKLFIDGKNESISEKNYGDLHFSLTQLEELTLQSVSNLNLFSLLISNADNLKQLTICGDISDSVSTQANGFFSLPKLETLAVCVENFLLLNALLEEARSLKKLILTNGESLGFAEKFDAVYSFPLTELDELSIESFSCLSVKFLEALLRNSSKLKTLNIGTCCNILDQFSPDAIFPLDSLEQLVLDSTTISNEVLEVLLRSSPNLKKVSLKNCSALVFTPALEALLGPIPEVWCDSDSEKPYSQPEPEEKPNFEGQKKICDTDITPKPDICLNVKRIFWSPEGTNHPPVKGYRKEIFNQMHLSKKVFHGEAEIEIDHAIDSQKYPIDLRPHPSDVFSLATSQHFYGRQTFNLTHQWQSIASLSPLEKMTHYHLSPHTNNVEIHYSEQNNLYYIRAKQGTCHVTFDFLVTAVRMAEDSEMLKKIREAYESDNGPMISTEDDKLLQKLKQGACRHRTIAFKWWMKSNYPNIPVRIVNNECHSFVEIKVGNIWETCDLGGHPGRLIIDESVDPKRMPSDSMPEPTHSVLRNISEQQSDFEQRLATWKTKTVHPPEHFSIYLQQLLRNEKHKHLIQLPSDRTHDLSIAIEQYAKDTHRPVFYIDSPEDLVCASDFVKLQPDKTGIICAGPGGKLHDFLTADRDPKVFGDSILMVNYNNFSAEDIVQFNALLDVEAHADGTPLPLNMRVLGLQDSENYNSYRGGDFYSRWRDNGQISTCPLALLPEVPPPLGQMHLASSASQLEKDNCICINLYHSDDWLTRLMGQWVLKEGALYFEEGELLAALASGKPIEIQNPPMSDAFELFWQQAKIHGILDENNAVIADPSCLNSIRLSEGYHWTTDHVIWTDLPDETAHVLNPGELVRFFSDYVFKAGQLNKVDGLLEAHARKTLPLYLTRALAEDEWAELLDESKKHGVTLSIARARGVGLPSVFKNFPAPPHIKLSTDTAVNDHTMCFESEDPDLTIDQIMMKNDENEPPWIVIDVSECTITDLLTKIDPTSHGKLGQFTFEQKSQVLETLLNENKKVLLTGEFSDELLDGLAPFLMKRLVSKVTPSGQLALVTSQPIGFLDAIAIPCSVSVDAKKQQFLEKGFVESELNAVETEKPSCFSTESFQKLLTRLWHRRTYPGEPSDNSWLGLNHLPSAIKLTPFDPDTSKQEAEAFIQQRINTVKKALASPHHPYVFLAGLTGVGKSSFVEKYLKTPHCHLYPGENTASKVAWAEGKGAEEGDEKILFIDEANLSLEQWSEFEGLFRVPRGIVIEGKYYPLTYKHKVIFAGNPLSYGDRQLSPLLQRHGNAVVFEPLSTAFIYEYVIKPVFENTGLTPIQQQEIGKVLLAAYQLIAERSTDEVLISPREVQMMALFVQQYHQTHPDVGLTEVATYYARHIGAPLLTNVVDKKAFDTQFPVVNLSFDPISTHVPGTADKKAPFIQTASRMPALQCLHEFMTLRQERRKVRPDTVPPLNEAQCYGGLGAITFEGEPGIAKSKMIIHYLLANGYKKADINHSSLYEPPENRFYIIPVSLDPEVKERILLKAFQEGSVVVMDEINSAPLMEKLLNSLLMGKVPDNYLHSMDTRPKHPGFTVIGTQNPISMEGRRSPTTAQSRRMQTCYVPPYPKEEMLKILSEKGLSKQTCHNLVEAFHFQREKARKKHLTPEPTFRDLLSLADDLIKEQSRKKIKVNDVVLPKKKKSHFSGLFKKTKADSDLDTIGCGVSCKIA